jgi:hypothetical protein
VPHSASLQVIVQRQPSCAVALDGYVRNLIKIYLLACQVITTHKGNKKGNIH